MYLLALVLGATSNQHPPLGACYYSIVDEPQLS